MVIKAAETTQVIGEAKPITGSPLAGDKFGLDLGPVTGTLTSSGAQISILVEEVTLTTTWTELTTSKATRNALNIQNRSIAEDNGAVNVYIRHSNSGTAGMKIVPGGERQYAISDVAIFAKVASGTHDITIEALA